MSPDRSCFTPLNLPSTFSLPECMDYFTLAAPPNTDLWRKPPDRDTSTAPILFTSMRNPFVVAEVTITADWEMEWDQGGLVIFAGPTPASCSQRNISRLNTRHTNDNDNNNSTNRRSREPPPPYPQRVTPAASKWVKAGLEFSAGTVNASSVSATADGADWCLAPLAPPNQPTSITSLRIKLERIGHSLWVWYQVPGVMLAYASSPGEIGSTWRKLREVTWFFWGVEDKSVHVGVYASRPANFSMNSTAFAMREGNRFHNAGSSINPQSSDGGGRADGLVVEFEDLEIF